MKFKIIATKEIKVDEEWFLKTFHFEIEAEDKTEAEWKVRKHGYSPTVTITLN